MNDNDRKALHAMLDKMIDSLVEIDGDLDALDMRLQSFKHDDLTAIDKYTEGYIELFQDDENKLYVEYANITTTKYDANGVKAYPELTIEVDWRIE